jgi:hypothetical protein
MTGGYLSEVSGREVQEGPPRRRNLSGKNHGKFFDAGVMVAYNSGPLSKWGYLQAGLVTVGGNVVREDEGLA